MSYPLPPGGQFPLTTAPTGRTAGGAFPLPEALTDAILSLQPTAYWPLDDSSGPLRSLVGGWNATVTGSPTYGVAAPSPIGRGVTWSGSGQTAATATSLPNPTTAMSLLAFVRSTNTGAARMVPVAATAATGMDLDTLTDLPYVVVRQANTNIHASTVCGSGAAVVTSSGPWAMLAGTFDGTTLRGFRCVGGSFSAASSTSLTGSWGKTMNGLTISALAGGSLWNGSSAHIAYWRDVVIPEAAWRWLGSIAFGG